MRQQFPSQATPQPSPLCAAYAPLLPLLNTDGLAPDEAESARAHLADCDWCRARLVEYDALYGALRSQFGPDTVLASAPSMREVAARSRRLAGVAPARPSAPQHSAPLRPVKRLRARLPLRVEVAAALLVVALLGALLTWQRGGSPGGLPPLDPQAREYLVMLHADYPPVLNNLGTDDRQCISVFSTAPQADKLADMTACKPVEQAVVTASQTLLTNLAKTPPPPRWRTAHGQLTAWANALIRAFTDRIQAIDAKDVPRFAALAYSEVTPASDLSCTPIQQINADLPASRQLPASAAGFCGV